MTTRANFAAGTAVLTITRQAFASTRTTSLTGATSNTATTAVFGVLEYVNTGTITQCLTTRAPCVSTGSILTSLGRGTLVGTRATEVVVGVGVHTSSAAIFEACRASASTIGTCLAALADGATFAAIVTVSLGVHTSTCTCSLSRGT